MKIKIILGVLFFVIFLQVCKKETPTAPAPVPVTYLHIEGLVTESNRPCGGATIELMLFEGWGNHSRTLQSVPSDKYGRYSINYGLFRFS